MSSVQEILRPDLSVRPTSSVQSESPGPIAELILSAGRSFILGASAGVMIASALAGKMGLGLVVPVTGAVQGGALYGLYSVHSRQDESSTASAGSIGDL